MFQTLELPYPDSDATHTLFYRQVSENEVEVFNMPLHRDEESLKELLTSVYQCFGSVDSVAIDGDKATVQFESEKGMKRAMNKQKKHTSPPLPSAVAGDFGLDAMIKDYEERHPDVDVLERISNEFIEAFEAREREMKENQTVPARMVTKMTTAEMNEAMRRYREKVKKMQSTNFYAFQTKNVPNLVTSMLTEQEKEPRHLKKQPKKKHTQE